MSASNGHIDVNRIIAEVASRHGILVHPTDPAFALVTINQLVLEESIERVFGEMDKRIVQFDASIQQLEQRAGKAVAQEIRKILAEVRQQLSKEIQTTFAKAQSQELARGGSRMAIPRWIGVGVLSGLVLFSAGFLMGIAWHWF
jgi:CHASE3 domain sensor protein